MNTTAKAAGIAVALAGYDTLVRPRILNWGASGDEQHMELPGDEIASGVPETHALLETHTDGEPAGAPAKAPTARR